MISGIAALLCVGGGLFSCTDEPGGANSSPTGGPIRSDDDLLVKVVKAKGEATRTKNTTDITGGFSHPSNVAITPDGVTAFVTNFGEDFVSAIDGRRGRRTRTTST
ncbi:MAG TPA: hypothetical protein VKH17_04390 [Acidimicrobiia bacterium]|nr:hypothetical protein [Acidimicrobiia bacterium]